MRAWLPAILGALIACIASCPAQAATVTAKEYACGKPGCATAFLYQAAPGEANRLVITPRMGGYLFADAGAAIRPGPACSTVADGVYCTFDAAIVGVQLGDGDDRVDASAVTDFTKMDGGPGADVLIGGSGVFEELSGGAGSDELFGGPGSNTLSGDGIQRPIDDSRAAPLDAPAAPDHIDGRGGDSTVSYSGRVAPVAVDLARGVGGEAGEGDHLVQIAGATGGRGPDSIRGTTASNGLRGGPGADTINGLEGNDLLTGDAGHDLLRGGAGNDSFRDSDDGLSTRDTDRILCADGSDSISGVALGDYISPDCERVEYFDDLRMRLTMASLRARAFTLGEFFCVDEKCSRTLTVRLARPVRGAKREALIGRSVFLGGANRRVKNSRGVRLTRLGRTLLERRTPLLVHVRLAEADTIGGRPTTRGFTTRLSVRR